MQGSMAEAHVEKASLAAASVSATMGVAAAEAGALLLIAEKQALHVAAEPPRPYLLQN